MGEEDEGSTLVVFSIVVKLYVYELENLILKFSL